MALVLGKQSKVHESYSHLLEEATQEYLVNIWRSPTEWPNHGRRFAAAITLQVAYGHKIRQRDDRLLTIVDRAMTQFNEMTAFNAYAVDAFPLSIEVRYVPEWFPGAGWKKKVPRYRDTLHAFVEDPFRMVKRRIAEGTSPSCFVSDLLSQHERLSPEEEQTTKNAAAGIYGGGSHTTAAALETFILAMTLHPEAQQKAQQELDTVLGRGVLPIFADRTRLPYCEALMQEVARLYGIIPIVPHVAAEDDVYNGYFIPKGSVILANTWLYSRDATAYADPEVFDPGRFIASEDHAKERDPRGMLFGYGRRLASQHVHHRLMIILTSPPYSRYCPGVHLADAALWLLYTSILALFDVKPPFRNGKLIFPSGKFMEGSISHPEPFECVIQPREGTKDMLHRLVEN
ncbi:hypothetical protein V5O48_007693 [Marasmius crinis-equi]|uniref:Cytochrome P450 n=1 Tax=Marasmius crinis-equi TaxID=585013 RepID=A0ABR3FFZ7_9AGAR